MHRRELILGLFLAAAIGYFYWRSMATPEAGPGGAHGATDLSALPPGTDVPLLALGRVNALPEMDEAKMRNLFNYTKSPDEFQAERDEAARIKKMQEEAAERLRMEQERQAESARIEAEKHKNDPPPPPPKPIPPEMNYRFLGYFGPPANKLAVLSDNRSGGDVQIVGKGDTFDGKFKLLGIDFESVTIGYTDPRFAQEQRTLRMGG